MPEIAPDLLQRLANYGLDERAIILLRETAPFVEPVIGPAMDFVIAGASKLSHIAELWRQHGDKLRRTEIRQFQALLRGEFDARYTECCRSTIEQQAALGFESRARMNCGAIVIKAASQIIARKYRYSNAVERAAIFSQAVMFDLATTETYYLATLEKAATLRRVAIDTAIADFDTAINGVLAAIKETSSSLIATSAIVQQVTNETGVRLHSAAGSSQETSNSVNIAVSSTSDMAASIQEIGQQTTRGLTMVRSALNDAERTKNTIRTLNEAAERIGSVVGLIAKIASHTNLLALNATIEAARAGEAGKGFAVVASEVKGLANQTSSATEDISQQVTAIQEATKGAVNEISLITQKINELAAVSASVASAIEEQEITTRQISSSFQLVLANTAYASNEIGSVELANKRSTAAVEEILAWTARLAAAAQDVDNKVGDFFARVRAA